MSARREVIGDLELDKHLRPDCLGMSYDEVGRATPQVRCGESLDGPDGA